MELAPQPGTLLADRYRLITPLARGGMGSVWRAEHLALGSEVAVKIIAPRVASGSMGVPRFLREARALASLRSPYIVQVLDFGTHGDIVYIVMELLEGWTLRQRLQAEGTLTAAETSRVLRHICRAMSHAHARGIVHRDLKPDNIFLCDHTRAHVTKVVDFGIAKPIGGLASSSTGTETGAFLGTPSYMSPEQCLGSRDLDHRSDLWSIGAIAYECLLGKRLFEGDVVGQLVVRICTEPLPAHPASSALPAGFDAWLKRAMAKNVADRFQSAAELADALALMLAGAATATTGVDSAETLGDGLAPLPPAQVASVVSTLENGSLSPPSHAPVHGKHRSARLAALGLTGVVVLGIVALMRIGSPSTRAIPVEAKPQVEQANHDAASREPFVATIPKLLPSATAFSSATAAAREQARAASLDGGVLSQPRKRASEPALVKPTQRGLVRSAPVQSAKPSVSAPDAPEIEQLRRKR